MSLPRLVLVEDHHLMRQGLAALLSGRGEVQIVGEAANGLEALALVEKLQPQLVLMDLSMPTLNGLDATRRIKQRYPRIAVLVLSMHNDPMFVARALHAGASGYILKESMLEELTLAIHAVLEGGVFLSPLVAAPIVQEYLRGAPAGLDPYAQLTAREREVLQLLAEGHSTPQIARMLTVSLPTVRSHQANLKRKLGIKNRAELVRFVLDHPPAPRTMGGLLVENGGADKS